MNTNIMGGARLPVHVVTDEELASGLYKLMGGAITPVDGVALADVEAHRGVMGGAALPVYFVTDPTEARWKIKGGARLPVVTAPATRPIESHVAIPIYDPDGYWGEAITYLLRDEFTTARAAGSVDGTAAEPGPGTRNVVDLDSRITIAAGALSIAAGGTSAWERAGLWYTEAITRVAGRVVALDTNLSAINGMMCGLTTVADANYLGYANTGLITLSGSTYLYARRTSNANSPEIFSLSTDTDYRFYQVLRANGRFVFIKTAGVVKLAWADAWSATATLYAGMVVNNNSTAQTIDNFVALDSLRYSVRATSSDSFNRADGAPGSTDGAGHAEADSGDGLAWAAESGTAVISSNALLFSALDGGLGIATVDTGNTDEFVIVEATRAGDEVGLVTRYVDENNYIRVYHDGTNVVADKVVGGAVTNVVSSAVAYAAGAKVSAVMDGTQLWVWYNEDYVDDVTIADAGVQTGTAHGVYSTNTGNTLDNWHTFPRTGYADLGDY